MNYIRSINRYFSTNTKSIYKSTKDPISHKKILNLVQFGYQNSTDYLKQRANHNLVYYGNSKVKEFIGSLKATAAHNNLFSLSATQVKSSLPIFCFYKDLSSHTWINKNSKKKLYEKSYEVCINPKIHNLSDVHHYEYEECSSFRFLKSKVKRPLRILASYIDEDGKYCEVELFDFEARVFCHEYEHLLGKTILDWKISKGEIILEGEEKLDRINLNEGKESEFKYTRFFHTLEHYKQRLLYEGHNLPTIFEKFDIQLLNKEYETFSEEQINIQNELKGKENWTIEDLMWIDLERAFRKDKNLKINKPSSVITMEDIESD